MAGPPSSNPPRDFGRRQPARLPDAPQPKRSSHVALLLMGTLAVGGGAYALMPSESCQPASPGMAAPASPATATACAARSSGGGGGGGSGGSSRSSRLSFFGGSTSSGGAAESSSTTRGGFGTFGRAFGFSGS
jgi:hypothetical protein